MPDSKVVAVGIVCIAAIASSFVYSHRTTLFAQNTKSKIPLQSALEAADNSGQTNTATATSDWKQAIANISVITPASDSANAVAAQQSGLGTPDSSNNLTAQVSKNFFSLYLQDQQNGVTIDDNEATNIADEALSNVQPSNLQTKQYAPADLHIINNSSVNSLLAYGKSISALIPKDIPQNQDPLKVVDNATQGQASNYNGNQNTTAFNQGKITGLNPFITGYQKLITDTLEVPVPASAVGDTLVYLDSLDAVENDLQSMSETFTDPVTGYAGINNYPKDAMTLMYIVKQMSSDLNK